MSTYDVPGANPANNDELAMGAWAEHEDGSLIMVESTEGGRVVFSVFDLAEDPIMEYRDAMPESGFKEKFSWDEDEDDTKWLWHDKTPFPWSRVIKRGAKDGLRFADVEEHLNAAQRLARSRKMKGQAFETEDYAQYAEMHRSKPARSIRQRIQSAINELRG